MKRVLIAIGLGLAACAAALPAAAETGSGADATEARDLGLQAYASCIIGEGRKLETSRQAAETVASAAVMSCSGDRVQAQQVVMLDLMVNRKFDVQKAGLFSEAFLDNF
ncbi:MAG: hypothetical protein JWQ97_2268, partial [Phenylobacterium sp.]|nr:hypothetical protein [Phenylobacterium sp.]